jgi:hypothetical protein
MFADEGPVFAAWHRDPTGGNGQARFRAWFEEWQAEARAGAAALQS